MIKTRSIVEEYEVCNLCLQEIKTSLYEDGYCDAICRTYAEYPTKESYLKAKNATPITKEVIVESKKSELVDPNFDVGQGGKL